MHQSLVPLFLLGALPALTMAQSPITTVFPLAPTMPACITACGPMDDANGACVPPAAPTASALVYDQCFCAYGTLQNWNNAAYDPTSMCPDACPGSETLVSTFRDWFTSFCGSVSKEALATATGSSSASSSTSTGNSSSSKNKGNQSWLDGHWKWVVMLVVLVVGIAGIWIGACLLHRRYVRKRDSNIQMRPSAAWGPNPQNSPYGAGVIAAKGPGQPGDRSSSRFEPTATPAISEKPSKVKKWIVRERT